MIFYDYKPAPSPRRARIFIAEKGLEIETVQVDLARGGQFEPAFKDINPRCTVPVLVLDDGTALTENTAIAVYLEALHPAPPLLGEGPLEKALVANWNERCVQEGFAGIAESYRNFSRGFADRALTGQQNYAQLPQLVERGRERAEDFFDTLNRRLSDTPYLAGERFTLADITALCLVDFAGWIKLAIDDREHLQRWYDAVNRRPSAGA